jgi:hypothetical protein
MTGIVNSTGARSGVVGTTVGTPAGGPSYETGTWDAQIWNGDNYTMSGSHDTGTYTKIGNLVTVTGFIKASSDSASGSGSNQIKGLPFAANSTNESQAGGVAGYGTSLGVTSQDVITCYTVASQTYIQLAVWDGSGGTSECQIWEWNGAGGIIFSLSYIVA